jgi:hypothetical protein
MISFKLLEVGFTLTIHSKIQNIISSFFATVLFFNYAALKISENLRSFHGNDDVHKFLE